MKQFISAVVALVFTIMSVSAQENTTNAALIIEKIITDSDIEEVQKKIDEIIANRDHYIINENELNNLGYRLIYNRKAAESIAVLKMNVHIFPDSWNVYDSLGEIYVWTNDPDNARINFEKSLELNPTNENAIKNISLLNGTISDHTKETNSILKYKCGENTGINKPYFGEEAPELTPKLFAPGIISTQGNFEFACTFTPDGKEFYLTRRSDENGINVIMVSKWEKKGWTAPDTANFSRIGWNNEPHITPDGNKLYFGTTRIKPNEDTPTYGIWAMNRIEDKWSTPEFAMDGMFVSTTTDGSIYLTDISRQTEGGIVKITQKQGTLQKPLRLDGGVNNPENGIHPCISPDESFIIFDCYREKEGLGGEGDLYVAFKDENEKWSEAYNLGELINGPGTDFCASISPDGKYLFYTRNRDIYWVSTKIIENLRPENLN